MYENIKTNGEDESYNIKIGSCDIMYNIDRICKIKFHSIEINIDNEILITIKDDNVNKPFVKGKYLFVKDKHTNTVAIITHNKTFDINSIYILSGDDSKIKNYIENNEIYSLVYCSDYDYKYMCEVYDNGRYHQYYMSKDSGDVEIHLDCLLYILLKEEKMSSSIKKKYDIKD